MYPYANYGGKASVLLGVTWSEASLSMILVALRAWGARTYGGKLRWDFILVVAAMVSSHGPCDFARVDSTCRYLVSHAR